MKYNPFDEIVAICENCGREISLDDIETETVKHLKNTPAEHHSDGSKSWYEYYECDECGKTIEYYAST